MSPHLNIKGNHPEAKLLYSFKHEEASQKTFIQVYLAGTQVLNGTPTDPNGIS